MCCSRQYRQEIVRAAQVDGDVETTVAGVIGGAAYITESHIDKTLPGTSHDHVLARREISIVTDLDHIPRQKDMLDQPVEFHFYGRHGLIFGFYCRTRGLGRGLQYWHAGDCPHDPN